MKLREEKNNDIVLCILEGEININNSPDLRKFLDVIIKRGDKKVVVDFSAVNYIDSSGLATLIEMLQRLKKIGGVLRFSNMEPKVKNIFEITKLHKLFEIFDSREMALNNL